MPKRKSGQRGAPTKRGKGKTGKGIAGDEQAAANREQVTGEAVVPTTTGLVQSTDVSHPSGHSSCLVMVNG